MYCGPQVKVIHKNIPDSKNMLLDKSYVGLFYTNTCKHTRILNPVSHTSWRMVFIFFQLAVKTLAGLLLLGYALSKYSEAL
jgi:hypothetical protein